MAHRAQAGLAPHELLHCVAVAVGGAFDLLALEGVPAEQGAEGGHGRLRRKEMDGGS
ncbi:hypothetical protein [Streptomyces atratus]|uniref:hypothetical protein n=1 Tax=Streptomyces atratus TaxID=1893 RepID=UPI002AC3386B|nr:hypothetical protein [Streptomyces atratus]WPW26039.1 hypothetical protein P6B95_00105 [Streptomyces atratus]